MLGVAILKVKWHSNAIIKKCFFRVIYGKNIYIGGGTTFRNNFQVYLEKGGKISIGDGCFFNNGCSINALDSIIIGNRNIFGEGVKIYDHNHKYQENDVPLKEQGFVTKPVEIGNDCWIGSNVTILQGVHIGNNCVIGANCLVYRDIGENSIVTCVSNLNVRIKT